jgi:MATE family multidrug resistance protein
MYAASGFVSHLLHTLTKLAEAFSVGSTVLAGNFNGARAYHEVGRTARDTFWLTIMFGSFFAVLLYSGASIHYLWCNADESIRVVGIPLLKLQAISVLFSFIYLGFFGFLRGIKNTIVPMYSFVIGGLVFVVVDYVLVLGKLGFPALGLQGSAIASIAQNFTMTVVLLSYILFDKENRKYAISLFTPFQTPSYFTALIVLSLPVMVDKVVFAMSYAWLSSMIMPMGKYWSATFSAVRQMEKVAIVPGLAFAQVITFLVSNDYARGNWEAIRSNIRKVVLLATCMVLSLLFIFSMFSTFLVSLFDHKAAFTDLAVHVFPIVSMLVIFDLLQLLLAGALRGAGDVRTVMWTRVIVCGLYFWPLSYVVSSLALPDMFKFIVLYSLFYLGTAFMSVFYINRIRGDNWHNQQGKL